MNKKIIVIMVIFSLMFICSSPVNALTIYPWEDSFTNEGDVGTSYENDNNLWVATKNMNLSQRRRSYFMLNQAPIFNYTNISDATLKVTWDESQINDTFSWDRLYQVCLVTENKSAFGWSNQPITNCISACSISFLVDGSSNIVLNVTKLMQIIALNDTATCTLSGGTGFSGLMIKDKNDGENGGYAFNKYDSSDAFGVTHALAPQIVFTFGGGITPSSITPTDINNTGVDDNTQYLFSANYQSESYNWVNKSIKYSLDGSTVEETFLDSGDTTDGVLGVEWNTGLLAGEFYIFFEGWNNNGDHLKETVQYKNNDRSDNESIVLRCTDINTGIKVPCELQVYNNTCDTYLVQKFYYPIDDIVIFGGLDNTCTYGVNVTSQGYLNAHSLGFNPNVTLPQHLVLSPDGQTDVYYLTMIVSNRDTSELLEGALVTVTSVPFTVTPTGTSFISNFTELVQSMYSDEDGKVVFMLPNINSSYNIVTIKDGYSTSKSGVFISASRTRPIKLDKVVSNEVISDNLVFNGTPLAVLNDTESKRQLKNITKGFAPYVFVVFFATGIYFMIFPKGRK